MSWEWEIHTKPQRWTLAVGAWHAIVQRVNGPGILWSTEVVSTSEPFIRYEGPTSTDPMRGRTWCLTKIAELRQEKS
jgi:hypothetical protein